MIQSYFPHLLGQFTDQLQADALTEPAVINYSVMLLGVGVSYGLLGGIGQFHIMYVGRLFEFFTRKRLFDHFTALSEHFYSKYGVGKLLSYVMNDVTAVRESISMGVNQTANAIFLLLSRYDDAVQLNSAVSDWCLRRTTPVHSLDCRPVWTCYPQTFIESTGIARHNDGVGGGAVWRHPRNEKICSGNDHEQADSEETVDQIRDNQLKLVRVSSLFQALIPFLGALSLVIHNCFRRLFNASTEALTR